MLSKDDLLKLEDELLKEIARRRGLGSYDINAPSILRTIEIEYEIIRHLRETASFQKRK